MKKRTLTAALALLMTLAQQGQTATAAPSDTWQQSRDKALAYLHGDLAKKDFRYAADWPALSIYAAGESLVDKKWSTIDGKNGLKWREADVLKGVNITSSTTDFESTLLGVLAAGGNPHSFGRKDLVEAIQGSQMPSGKFADTIYGYGDELLNAHIYGIIALYASGHPIPKANLVREYLLSKQHADGGFHWSNPSKTSDPDTTAMALIAMKILHLEDDHPAVQRAFAYLKSVQTDQGGFRSDNSVNSDTTATVIEALTEYGIDPTTWQKGTNNPVTDLLSYQQGNGGFAYAKGTSPVTMMSTQNAVLALSDLLQGTTVYERLSTENAPRAIDWTSPFPDLPINHPRYREAMQLVNLGVMAGDSSGKFLPDDSLTREQFAKLLVYGLDLKEKVGEKTTKFTDVGAGSWSNPFIQVAVKEKLILGTSANTFEPLGNVTGGQLMAILVRGLGMEEAGTPQPGQSNWYDRYVQVAKEQGLWYPNFSPTQLVTRADVCASFANFYRAQVKLAAVQQQ
ncbi:MAG: S-layer homology domain-containing protein [Tumebacillaceae bacterium]